MKPLEIYSRNEGFCYGCNQLTTFEVRDVWLRDHYVCLRCGCIPRERALMFVLETVAPDWSKKVIHESSPVQRGPSLRFAAECPGYIASQFWRPENLGKIINGVRNESLERLTFADASIDIHVSQDVFEHVFDIDAAAREIARTLRPGGLHVFTAPLVRKSRPTVQRTRRSADGTIEHLFPPEYHGNPIDERGALVVWHFGYDLADRIQRSSGMTTTCYMIDNMDLGIRAEYIEVLVSRACV